jgi:hypothetical protein
MEKKVIEVKDLGTTLEYYPEAEGVREVFGIELAVFMPKLLGLIKSTADKTEAIIQALEAGDLSLQEVAYLAAVGEGNVADNAIETLGPAVAGVVLGVSAAKEKMSHEGLGYLVDALEAAASERVQEENVEEGS